MENVFNTIHMRNKCNTLSIAPAIHSTKGRGNTSLRKSNKCEMNKKPNISSVSLDLSVKSGIGLKIFGHGLLKTKRIYINFCKITEFVIMHDCEIKVIIPKTDKKKLYVSVSTNKYVSNMVCYELVNPPTITKIDPSFGSISTSNSITIFGTNLATLQYISFNNLIMYTSSNTISVISDNMASFMIPFINITDNVPISVTTVGGTSNIVCYNCLQFPII